jgi:hypothetical protein
MSEGWDAWAQMAGLYFGQEGQHGEYVGPRLQERVTVDEWSLPGEGEKLASSVSGIQDKLIELASIRWQKGVEEYRGGDETKPFEGDPLAEALDEAADIFAYAKEADSQGILTREQGDDLFEVALAAFKVITNIQASIKEKDDKEKERKARQEASKEIGLIVEIIIHEG